MSRRITEPEREEKYLPARPTLTLSTYIADYRVRKRGKEYLVQYRLFYRDKWYSILKFKADGKGKKITEYLRDKNKKDSIIQIANEYIERMYPRISSGTALARAIQEKWANYKNIEQIKL